MSYEPKTDPSFSPLKPVCKDFDLLWGNLNYRSQGEPRPDTSSIELDVGKLLDSIKSAQKGLLLQCGYTEKDVERANNIKNFLYMKPVFILKNTKSEWNLLKIYLADQEALFTYSDERYWTRRVSQEFVAARRLLARDSDKRKHLYNILPAWNETIPLGPNGKPVVPMEDRDLHIALLNRIFDAAAQSRMSLVKWVKNTFVVQLQVMRNEWKSSTKPTSPKPAKGTFVRLLNWSFRMRFADKFCHTARHIVRRKKI